MGPAFPCRKLGKTIRDSPLAASPIPTTASLKRLVNSARFDKAGRTTAANMTPEYQDAFFEPGWHTAASSGGLAAPNPAVPIQYSHPISTGALREGHPQIRALRSPGIVRCTRASGDSRKETLNSALSRNAFLIFWKPRSPNLILRVCPVLGKHGNLFVNSVLARMADCQPAVRS